MECALLLHQRKTDELLRNLPTPGAPTNHSPFQWLTVATFYRKLRRYEDALTIYRTMAAVHVSWPEPWLQIAATLRIQKNHSSAAKMARHLITIDPKNEKAHLILSSSLYRQGETQEALQILTDFKKLIGGSRNSQRLSRIIANSTQTEND